MKRWKMSVLVMLMMVLSLMGIGMKVEAADVAASGSCGADGADVKWSYEKGKLSLTGKGNMAEFQGEVPWEDKKEFITSVDISEGIYDISASAFYKCTNLTSVSIPASVYSIGYRAFGECEKLTSVELKEGNLDTIREDAFRDCGLTQIQIPSGVTDLGDGFVADCKNLTGIFVSSGNSSFVEENGILYNKGKTVLVAYPGGKTEDSFVVPSTVNTVRGDAFSGCKLKNLTFPDSVKKLEGGMCEGCLELETVVMGNSVDSIGMYAFSGCSKLKNVTFSKNLKEIMSGAFLNCTALSEISLPDQLEYIRKESFYGTGISSVVIPDSVKQIEKNAFPAATEIKTSDSQQKNEDGSYIKSNGAVIGAALDYKRSFEMLDVVNAERKKNGFDELVMDQDLLTAAMQRAAEISIVYGSERPNGLSCLSVSDKMTAENIAYGNSSAGSVMLEWKRSTSPREAMLSKDAKIAGVGCVKIGGIYYWTACFGKDKTDKTAQSASYKNVSKNMTVNIVENSDNFTLKVNSQDSTIAAGQTTKVNFSLYNINTKRSVAVKNATLKSSNTKKTSITSAGTLQGKAAGTITVTGYLNTNKNIKATKKIKIEKKDQKVTKVKVSGDSKYIAYGKKITLKAKVTPSYAANTAVTWKSSNKRYASVSKKGVVTTKKAGRGKTVLITATAKDGSGKKGTYRIKIMKGVVKKLKISGASSVKEREKIQLKVGMSASKGAYKTVKWSVDNTKYASISSKGKLYAKYAGKGQTVVVTVEALDGSGVKGEKEIVIK
ncbi:MAG: leucine-rich repeat protein [Lachnospiraceae bacterium]|nr:leucine-rich repeat protein [Lachnospiraceae bacterium]